MISAGIDSGSRTIKVVIYDSDRGRVLAKGVADQGIHQSKRASELYNSLLEQANLSRSDISNVIATGYGRNLIDFADRVVTEITCQAAGVLHQLPGVKSIIDIGGQDSKFILVDSAGKVRNFAMNDRCAAGTGRFLEVTATRLDIEIDQLSELANKSENPESISSMCVVFAETEIISLLAEGKKPADIAKGVMRAIASRVVSMSGNNLLTPIAFTGGVALIDNMRDIIEDLVKDQVIVVPDPQVTAALGAAVIAAKS